MTAQDLYPPSMSSLQFFLCSQLATKKHTRNRRPRNKAAIGYEPIDKQLNCARSVPVPVRLGSSRVESQSSRVAVAVDSQSESKRVRVRAKAEPKPSRSRSRSQSQSRSQSRTHNSHSFDPFNGGRIQIASVSRHKRAREPIKRVAILRRPQIKMSGCIL